MKLIDCPFPTSVEVLKTFLVFLIVTGTALIGWTADTPARDTESARRVWERVIAAKGGRERLRAVRSLGVIAGYVGTQGLRSFHSYSREVYEFPSRGWIRAEDPPYRAGLPQVLILQAWDADAGLAWFTNGTSDPARRDLQKTQRLAKENSCHAMEWYLLESKWYQPEIVAVRESKWMKRTVTVIYVNSCSGPAAYVIDPKTSLPIAFIILPIHQFGDVLPDRLRDHGPGTWRFDEYESVDGILMPRKTVFGETKYEINRAYPRTLFTTPPRPTEWGPWPPPTSSAQ